MARTRILTLALAMFLVLARALVAAGTDATTGDDLAPLLEPIRQQYQLPGLVAAVVRDGRVVGAGAVGVREVGKGARVELGDRFHIGSCTKAMTAMLIARLIDQGKLTWDTTLTEALPGVAMRPEYRTVTIRQLLTFRGGIPPYTTFRGGELPPSIVNLKGNDPADIRLQFARAVLNEPPAAAPGTAPVYSNASYAVAATILDRLAGRPWEAEITEGLFRPLGMTAAVIGPSHFGSNDQPSGHRKEGAGPGRVMLKKESQVQPKANEGRGYRLAPPLGLSEPLQHVMAPAGGVSCSIVDFARYAGARLAGLHGKGPLLSADTYAAMARSDDDEGFTAGTGRLRTLGKDGREYQANGSGGLFLAGIRLLPDQDAAIVCAMNAADPGALAAVVNALKDRYMLPK